MPFTLLDWCRVAWPLLVALLLASCGGGGGGGDSPPPGGPPSDQPLGKVPVALMRVSIDQSYCASGGSKLEAGFDLDGNQSLDDSEVRNTQYICNGLSTVPIAVRMDVMPAG